MKIRLVPDMERLRATLESVKRDKSHFNQGLWVSPPNSKKWPETCGDFAWFAVQKYGTSEQKKKFTWDKAHDWVGPEILGLTRKLTSSLFWGGNTIEMIEGFIDRLEEEI